MTSLIRYSNGSTSYNGSSGSVANNNDVVDRNEQDVSFAYDNVQVASTGIPSLDKAFSAMRDKAGGVLFPTMISAVYRGGWKVDNDTPTKSHDKDPISVNLSGPIRPPGNIGLINTKGDTTMQLVQEDTIFTEIKKVRGIMRIYDGDRAASNVQAMEFEIRGCVIVSVCVYVYIVIRYMHMYM